MFKNFIEDWEWEDTAKAVTTFFIVALLALILTAVTKKHDVDYYYLSLPESPQVATCVYANQNWNFDSRVFCTDDKDKALDFVTKANATLRK